MSGTLVGSHVVPPLEAEDLPFTLSFDNLLGLQMIELDFANPKSTFVEVTNSKWLARMRRRDSAAKVEPEHRHYRVMTYDDVFDVVCTGYALTVCAPDGSRRP